MKVIDVSTQVSVSDQITPDDVKTLADNGIQVIVCNRPDNEAADQTDFAEIKHAAEALGLEAYHIPFVASEMNQSHVDEFKKVLGEDKKLHAYCRTGNRSNNLFMVTAPLLAADEAEKKNTDVSANSQDALNKDTVVVSAEEVATRESAVTQESAVTPAPAETTSLEKDVNTTAQTSAIPSADAPPKESAASKAIHPSAHAAAAKPSVKPQLDVVIMGGGSGGIALAASLLKRRPILTVAIIEPSDVHYYQPGWTMVGGGVFDVISTRRTMVELIPDNVVWLQNSVSAFQPADNTVVLDDGTEVLYSQLVVAPGIKLNWSAIEGLEETLGRNGVTSNYRYDLAPYTWQLVRDLKQGQAVFTQPPMPIKCAGAPQKALYLSADHWLKNNHLQNISIDFFNAGGVLFGVPAYVPALQSYIDRYGANVHYSHNLTKIDGETKTAWFTATDGEGNTSTIEKSFDMIHVCPPQCAPDVVRNSELADAGGWLDVDQFTLQHKRFSNVWGIGDVMNTPNAKTMAAARKQAPVLAHNLANVFSGLEPTAKYDGYGSCPLTVERGKIVLAEFGYGGKLLPTFPEWILDGKRPTSQAWFLKEKILPAVYWNAMLKGHEWFAGSSES